MKRQTRAVSGMVAWFLGAGMTAWAASPPTPVSLVSPTTETAVSGAKGTAFVLGDGGSSTQALYGIQNWEQSDEPCKVTVKIENISNSSQDSTKSKDLCGGHTPGDEIQVSFEDSGAGGSRAFVTGVRVCMNSSLKKVKGISIKGLKITDAGELAELDPMIVMETAGGQEVRTERPNIPSATRPNCDDKDGWKKWVECPAGSLATAAIVHYAAGKEPRDLTGIALKCRVLKKGTPAP